VEEAQLAAGWGDFVDVDEVAELDESLDDDPEELDEPEEESPELDDEEDDDVDDDAGSAEDCLARLSVR
jgi:hypothetical protein